MPVAPGARCWASLRLSPESASTSVFNPMMISTSVSVTFLASKVTVSPLETVIDAGVMTPAPISICTTRGAVEPEAAWEACGVGEELAALHAVATNATVASAASAANRLNLNILSSCWAGAPKHVSASPLRSPR